MNGEAATAECLHTFLEPTMGGTSFSSREFWWDSSTMHSMTIDERRHNIYSSLRYAVKEAKAALVEQHSNNAYDVRAWHSAMQFVCAYPLELREPTSIDVHSDGEFAFEWYESPDKVLVISIGQSGRLAYASRSGDNNSYGTEFQKDAIPNRITEEIKRFITT